MDLDQQPNSFQMQIASNMASNRSGSSIPAAGGTGISAQVGGSLDLGFDGLESTFPIKGNLSDQSVFSWADNCALALAKLTQEPALAPLQSELGKAGLQQLNIVEQTSAKIAGATGFISPSGGQEH
jgi:hypothetical protein